MWCAKFALILLFFELRTSFQHSLAKVGLNNDKEIFLIKELPDKAVEFINTKPEEPTIREIVYYHIVEKPYKEEHETAKDDNISTAADTTTETQTPSLVFDQSTRHFTNGQGFQFFDSHSEETGPVEKTDKSSDRRGIQHGESKLDKPSQDSVNKNSVEDITKKQDINGKTLDTSEDTPYNENKKKESVVTTIAPATIDEKEKLNNRRRKREISLGIPPQGPTLPDFGLSDLPDYIQNMYKASPDFSKYFGSNNAKPQSNGLYVPSVNNEDNTDKNPEYQSSLNYIPANIAHNPQNDPVFINNVLKQQLQKSNNNKKSNSVNKFNIPNLLMRNEGEPTYGMDIHNGQGSVWNNIAQQPFVNQNIGQSLKQARPKGGNDQIENHKIAKTNVVRPEDISRNDQDKNNENINPESNNDDLPYFTDTGVEIPPAPKILEPRNDEADNVDLKAHSVPKSSLKINKLKQSQGRINAKTMEPTSSHQYRENLRTNLNHPSKNSFENKYNKSTKGAYINTIKKSINNIRKKMPKSVLKDQKQDSSSTFINKNNIINNDDSAFQNKFNSIIRNNGLSVPDLEQTTKPQIKNLKSSTDANNSNFDNNNDDKNSKDTYYNKIKKSFENILSKMSLFPTLSSKTSDNDNVIKENQLPEKKFPIDSKKDPSLINSHDDEMIEKGSQPSSQTETTTEEARSDNKNNGKSNTLKNNNIDKIEKSFDDVKKVMHSLSPSTKQGPAVEGTYGMRLMKDNGYVWNDLNPKHETFIHIHETTTEDVKKNEPVVGPSTESSFVTTLNNENGGDIESNPVSNVHTNKYNEVTTKQNDIIPSNSEELITGNETTTTKTVPEIRTEPTSKAKLTTINTKIPSHSNSKITPEENIKTTTAVNLEDLKKTDSVPISKSTEMSTEPTNDINISTNTGEVPKSDKSTDITPTENTIQTLATSSTTKITPTTNDIDISKDKDFESTTAQHFDETTDNMKSTPKNITDNNLIESTTVISENHKSNETSDTTTLKYPNTTEALKKSEHQKKSKNTNSNKINPKKHKKEKSIKTDLNELIKKKEFWDWLSGWTSSYIKDLKKYTKEIVKEEVTAQIQNITHNLKPDNVPKSKNDSENINKVNDINPSSQNLGNHSQEVEQTTVIPKLSETTGNKSKIPIDLKNKTAVNIDGDTIYGNTVGVTNVFIFLNDTDLKEGTHISELNDTLPKVTNTILDKNKTNIYPLNRNQTQDEHLSSEKLPIENEIKAESLSTQKAPLLNSDFNATASKELTTTSPISAETTTIMIKNENKTNNSKFETNKDEKILAKSNEIIKESIEESNINKAKEKLPNKTNVTEASTLPNTTESTAIQKDNITVQSANISNNSNVSTENSANENNLSTTNDNMPTAANTNSNQNITSTELPVSIKDTSNILNSTASVLSTTAAPQVDNSTKLNKLIDKGTSLNSSHTTTKPSKVDDPESITSITTPSSKTETTKISIPSEVNNSTETPAESNTISKLNDEIKTSTTQTPNNRNITSSESPKSDTNGNSTVNDYPSASLNDKSPKLNTSNTAHNTSDTNSDNSDIAKNKTLTTQVKNSTITVNVTTENPKIENVTVLNDENHINNNITEAHIKTDEKVSNETTIALNNTESTTLKENSVRKDSETIGNTELSATPKGPSETTTAITNSKTR